MSALGEGHRNWWVGEKGMAYCEVLEETLGLLGGVLSGRHVDSVLFDEDT
jgi:hypothetical protein